jgi:hypothetical protein
MHVPLLCLHYAVAISYLRSVETSRLTSRAVRVLPTILCIRCSLLGAGGRKSAWETRSRMDGCIVWLRAVLFFISGSQKEKS